MRIYVLFLLFAFLPQAKNFEGRVVYSIKEFNSSGQRIVSPSDENELIFGKNVILTKTISGPIIQIVGNTDVYLNAETNQRFAIDHDRKQIRNVGPEDKAEIVPLKEYSLGEELINGHMCEINFIRYIHRFQSYGGISSDTLSCTFYNSKEYKIKDVKTYGNLQGNRNTLFLDGRFDGLPLKVILERNNGSKILIECSELFESDTWEVSKLPNYPITKN